MSREMLTGKARYLNNNKAWMKLGSKDTRSKDQLRAELQTATIELESLRRRRHSEGGYSLAKTIAVSLAVVAVFALISFTITDGISMLAGRSTEANVAVQFLASFDVYIGWAVGVAGVIYGRSQRVLAVRTRRSMGNRLKAAQLVIDPNRSSSDLTLDGETNPGDEL